MFKCLVIPHRPLLQITGCSSGLGRALAWRLHSEREPGSDERAYHVFASARSAGSLRDLEVAGIDTVQLDVSNQVGAAQPGTSGLRDLVGAGLPPARAHERLGMALLPHANSC